MNDDVKGLVAAQLELALYELGFAQDEAKRRRAELELIMDRVRAKEAEVSKWQRALEE